MSKDNGGPAFPSMMCYSDGDVYESTKGMTLRDYFAIRANEHDINAQCEIMSSKLKRGILPENWHVIARYMHADAMLKAREV